ncbi:MAG: polysaccharide biosynthesis/export family protein [Candidatus Acidiferrales bacterium]
MAVLLLIGWQAAYGQAKDETSQQTNEKIQQLATLASARPVDTAIGSGDLLHVDVFDVPELSREVRVGDGGDISYPLIPGKIAAAGLTPFELEEKLEQLLIENGLVSHPQVSVFVKEQTSQPVSVVGAVQHTMVYQVMRPTTLLEVLSAAGGITDDAGSVVVITRVARPGKPRTQTISATDDLAKDQQIITIRWQDLLESGNAVFNVPVYGGDVVSIPRAGIVYVLGLGVAQPGGYVLQSRGEQVTVLKAVALAHGLTGFAKANSAVIMRTNPATGNKDQIPVRIKAIENHQTEDVALKSNDVLYVPDSRAAKVLARGGEAMLGIGTQIAVFRAP